MSEGLDLEVRQKIYQLVSKHPGVHARKIAEMLSLTGQLVDYHLLFLEKQDILSSKKVEGYRRYFVRGRLGIKQKLYLSVLRREALLRIVLFLVEHPEALSSELLDEFDISPSTLSYHLNRLVRHGVLESIRVGKEKKFRLADAEEMTRLLIQYKPYSTVAGFADTFVDLKIPKKKKGDTQ